MAHGLELGAQIKEKDKKLKTILPFHYSTQPIIPTYPVKNKIIYQHFEWAQIITFGLRLKNDKLFWKILYSEMNKEKEDTGKKNAKTAKSSVKSKSVVTDERIKFVIGILYYRFCFISSAGLRSIPLLVENWSQHCWFRYSFRTGYSR